MSSFNTLHREDVVFEPNFVLPIPLLQIFPHSVWSLANRTDVVETPNSLGELLKLITEIQKIILSKVGNRVLTDHWSPENTEIIQTNLSFAIAEYNCENVSSLDE